MADEVSKKRQTLARARELRDNATDAESKLWAAIRGRALSGLKFRRQQPYGSYILDFYCHEKRLVIELDGGQHYNDEQLTYDSRRSAFLQARGLEVLRFTNLEVLQNIDGVAERILDVVTRGPSPAPSPPGRGSNSSTLR